MRYGDPRSTTTIPLSTEQRQQNRIDKAIYRQQRDQIRAGKVTQHYNTDGSRKEPQWANPDTRMSVGVAAGFTPEETQLSPSQANTVDPYAASRSRRRGSVVEDTIWPQGSPQAGTPPQVPPIVVRRDPPSLPAATPPATPAAPTAPAGPRSVGDGKTTVVLQPDEILGPDGKAMKKRKGGTINGMATADALDPVKSAIRRQQRQGYG